MKLLSHFFIALLFCCFAGQISAQELTKEEKKEYQKLAKEYKKNPASLKVLTENHERLQDEKAELLDQVNTLETTTRQLEAQVAQKEQQVAAMNEQLINAEQNMREMRNSEAVTMTEKTAPMGLIFRVQIGAYQKTSIPENLATSDDMALENADGMQKVMVGQFYDYQQAKELQGYLKKIGIKDAWVVPYRDGVRISLDEAVPSQNQ